MTVPNRTLTPPAPPAPLPTSSYADGYRLGYRAGHDDAASGREPFPVYLRLAVADAKALAVLVR